jgi:hypothetical protein
MLNRRRNGTLLPIEKMMKKIIAIVGVSILAGCAANTGIVPIGQDTFMVSRQAATGFSGSGSLKAEAFQEASAYCTSQGKSFQVVNSYEAQPPFIFGNFPKAEVQFMCLSKGDAELVRPKMRKEANMTIELRQ